MPKLMNTTGMDVTNIPGLSGYSFSSVRPDKLGASEYTLVTIAVDISTSVQPFAALLIDSVKKAVDACRKSPRVNNILIRVIGFANDVTEIHGFKPLSEIDLNVYDNLSPRGSTALFDASASAIGAMTEYGRVLQKQDFAVSGILFIITDGEDNGSTFGADTVLAKATEATSGEVLESFLSVLVGINATHSNNYLMGFQADAGLTQYVDAGKATPGNLAKLAAFVSRSVSSGTIQAASASAGATATITI
jgi:hypothetical protein